MPSLSSESYISFLSSNAQVFGALIGLLGLTFVRISETIEENIGRMVASLVRDFMTAIAKTNPEVAELTLDIREFGPIIDRYQEKLGDDYHMLKSRYLAIDKEVDRKKEFRSNFIINCWVSLILIVLSMLGLLIPNTDYPTFSLVFTVLLFLASVVGVYLTVRFYIAVANTTMILTVDSN